MGEVVFEQFDGVAEADGFPFHHPVDDGAATLAGSHAVPEVGIGADDQAGGFVFVEGAGGYQVLAVFFELVALGGQEAFETDIAFDALD